MKRLLPPRTGGWVLLLIGLAGLAHLAARPRPQVAFSFEHHFITSEMPGNRGARYGMPALADFDGDGDLDYAFGVSRDSLYWFENDGPNTWRRHTLGQVPVHMLGAVTLDVDRDGWVDLVTGGYWFRNPQNPREAPFERYAYDDTIQAEIHDMAVADVDGDGEADIVALGDRDGCFWYRRPEDARRDQNWPRTTITMAVLDDEEDIHSGFSPGGVADLDGDGDVDVVLPDRWLENRDGGQEWTRHPLPFGKRGPWGLSARSWIVDLDEDGDTDIVITDSDQAGSGAAWLESDGAEPPAFTAHALPQPASGTRGSFHSLAVADFDGDGDVDVFTAEQEDDSILPEGAGPRWFIWENLGDGPQFAEHIIYEGMLGGHDVIVGDVDGDGDPDLASKVWSAWSENANGGGGHADFFENRLR